VRAPAVVDVGVDGAVGPDLQGLGEDGGVARGEHHVDEDAVAARDVELLAVVEDGQVRGGGAEEAGGVAEARAFHEAGGVSDGCAGTSQRGGDLRGGGKAY